MIYSFRDDKPTGIRQFGLNTGKVVSITWDNEPYEALTVEVLVDGDQNPMRLKKFPVEKVFVDGQMIEKDDPRFEEASKKQVDELTGVLSHIFKVFVPIEVMEKAFENKEISSFAEYCKILIDLLPKDYNTIPIDIFLQYQFSLPAGKDKTYLEIPKNVKHGVFICKHVKPVGSWREDRSNGLRYVDNNNTVHPFIRKKWFMDSNFAQVQNDAFNQNEPATSSAQNEPF